MNIRDYYKKTAKSCYYVAWITLILAILFFICHILKLFPKDLLTFAIPLIILSIAHFISFRLYQDRVEKLGNEPFETSVELFHVDHILFAFMPAPTLRLLLYDHKGLLLGEIRDQNMHWFMWMIPNFLSLLLPKKYVLLNNKEEVVAKYHLKAGLTNSMTVYNANHEIIGYYNENWKDSLFKVKGTLYKSDWIEWIVVSSTVSLYSLHLQTVDKKKVASFQEGWMPVEWAKRFEINTPIITFSSIVEESERIIVLGFLTTVLHHRDH